MLALDEILVLRLLTAKADADPAALEAAMAGAPAHTYLLRADRGTREGQVAIAASGSAPAAADLGERVARAAARLAPLVASTGQTFEYRLLSREGIGPLPSVDVLGMHYHQVREGRREAFEQFVEETVSPAVGRLRPDLRLLYYRTVGPANAGPYVTIFALTRESRDRYWPDGSDSDLLRAAFAPVRGLTAELKTYLVDGSFLADDKFAASVYESRDWTDFVVVSPPSPSVRTGRQQNS
jgi:hypothetical protein